MLKIKFLRGCDKFIKKLPAKHQNQIALKIQELRVKGKTTDSKKLWNYPYYRADAGEYRIIFDVKDNVLLIIVLVGKRNDDEVYKRLSRKKQ